MEQNLEQNKQDAIAFYRGDYLGDPSTAVEQYVGAEYIQHNPQVADGKQAFIDYFDEMARDYPSKSIEFVRAVAENDTHSPKAGSVRARPVSRSTRWTGRQ